MTAQVSPPPPKLRTGTLLLHSQTVLSSIPRRHQLHSYPDSGRDHPGQRGQPEVQVQPLKGLGRYFAWHDLSFLNQKLSVSAWVWQFLHIF